MPLSTFQVALITNIKFQLGSSALPTRLIKWIFFSIFSELSYLITHLSCNVICFSSLNHNIYLSCLKNMF